MLSQWLGRHFVLFHHSSTASNPTLVSSSVLVGFVLLTFTHIFRRQRRSRNELPNDNDKANGASPDDTRGDCPTAENAEIDVWRAWKHSLPKNVKSGKKPNRNLQWN